MFTVVSATAVRYFYNCNSVRQMNIVKVKQNQLFMKHVSAGLDFAYTHIPKGAKK